MLWQSLKEFIFPSQYMSHGYCYLWQKPLVALHLVSDLFIALAYFSIPAVLLYFLKGRKDDTPLMGIVELFGAFIILCGIGHVLDIWTLWQPVYWLSGFERLATAIVSGYTAVVLVAKIPVFLALRSPEDLETLNQELLQEVAERQRAEAALAEINRELESRVQERTQELTHINQALAAEVKIRQDAEMIVQRRSQRLNRQQWALGEVVGREVIYAGDLTAAFQELNQLATATLQVARSSIWLYDSDRTHILCYDLYDHLGQQHNSGVVLALSQYPSYFQALETDRVIVAHDAYTDPRLQELRDGYLKPLQITAMLDTAVRSQRQVVGVLCLEHIGEPRRWEIEEQNFARYLATAVTMALDGYDRKCQQEALQEAKEMADAANLAKSSFLASMSHELRTPLNAILGFTQLMDRDESLPPQHRQPIQIINKSGQHLIELINNVLQMSRIEANRVDFEPEQFNLHETLESLCSLFEARASKKGLALKSHVDFDISLDLVTDRKKLQQVLINLLGNALKFTERGQIQVVAYLLDAAPPTPDSDPAPEPIAAQAATPPTPSPETQTGDPPKKPDEPSAATEENLDQTTQTENPTALLRVDVRDTGPGIAAPELANLFEAFSQTKTGVESGEGTGLGLSISQRLMQIMGGQIQVQSQVGQGTTFHLDLPVGVVRRINACILPQYTQRIVHLAEDSPSIRILIVEDRTENRLLLNYLLTRLGFEEIREAYNGSEALFQWELWQPHLILMDLRMPIMDGLTATREIRARIQAKQQAKEPVQDSVIIALTASAFESERQEMLKIGCNDFISKPFQDEELLRTIGRHLELRFVEQAMAPPQESLRPLQPQDLQVMPAQWLVQVWEMAIQGNDLVLLKLLDQVPREHQGIGIRFRQFIHDFQFEEIVNLIEALDLDELRRYRGD